jgi:hypothetical protein
MSWFLTTFPLAFWWGLLAYLAVAAVALWVGYQAGRARGRVVLAPIPPDSDLLAEAESRGFARGWKCGYDETLATTEDDCRRVLKRFPNSMGLRAAMRAIGLTVPPITRKRASTEGADA